MPLRSSTSLPASRFSMRPFRPSVITCGCSSRSKWSAASPALRCFTSPDCNSSAQPYEMRPSSRSRQLRIESQTVHGVERVSHRFIERGMGVDGAHHSLHRSLGFHGCHRLRNQFERVRSDDVHSQNLAELLAGYHLDKAFMMSQDGGP